MSRQPLKNRANIQFTDEVKWRIRYAPAPLCHNMLLFCTLCQFMIPMRFHIVGLVSFKNGLGRTLQLQIWTSALA